MVNIKKFDACSLSLCLSIIFGQMRIVKRGWYACDYGWNEEVDEFGYNINWSKEDQIPPNIVTSQDDGKEDKDNGKLFLIEYNNF